MQPNIPLNKNTNGNTKTDVTTTGTKIIEIIGLIACLTFQVLIHLTIPPAANPIMIAAIIPKLIFDIVIEPVDWNNVIDTSFGIPGQYQYNDVDPATNEAINPGANALRPAIDSAIYAPIIPIKKVNPTLATCIAYHIGESAGGIFFPYIPVQIALIIAYTIPENTNTGII